MTENNTVNLFEIIETQDEMFEVMGGAKKQSYSARKGNDGHICTITVECMQICSWF